MRVSVVSSAFLVGFPLLSHSAFGFTVDFSSRRTGTPNRFRPLSMVDTNDNWLDIKRQGYKNVLKDMDTLQGSIEQANSTVELEVQMLALEQVEKEFGMITAQFAPPEGLSLEDYQKTIKTFLTFPPELRVALVTALELEEEAAGDFRRIPDIVTKLYEQRFTLTPQRLADSLKAAKAGKEKVELSKQEKSDQIISELFDDMTSTEVEEQNRIKQLLGRVTRKEGFQPTEKDLEILVGAFDSSTFVLKGKPEKIPGGYVIRGNNQMKSSAELIDALDAKLPTSWNGTVSYMPDMVKEPELFTEVENVLVLFHNDFSPETNEWFFRFTSAGALATAFLFSVGVYGSTDALTVKLTDLAAVGDFSGVDLFNGKIAEVLLPLAVILTSHEIGHLLIARKENITTASGFPTLIPFWSSLPLLGSLTRISSSPRDKTALFDFAFLGPLLGFVSSFIFLGIGLVATGATIGTDAAQYLPALPVSVLKMSTLGATIVDNFFGGNGYIIGQDPSQAISLHPYAIAGFCGMMINALEMIPLGSTDGGRLSQSLFGRQGHSAVGGFAWLALLISAFTMGESQGAALTAAWIVASATQNDMEVPARDETGDVNTPRSLAAFSIWFLAFLAVVPMA
jgi:membrane-associated protease RseP (regulator of RpoE activity)